MRRRKQLLLANAEGAQMDQTKRTVVRTSGNADVVRRDLMPKTRGDF